ncbi:MULTISPECIES: DUF3224 domain-containing protein [unclassified Streptomyces]|uniref:DUF3224 domain-containing protein n=1 Tax=unclassified Streptomyces TaxID=2593676 RepID=UPI00035F53EB|nr:MULTISPECIES: DUF3224 domain-containing protein [unclassified Streptomyces]MYT27476.1 DUF3224 domain-containing protein [Streptomyces sp. SID8354]
MPTQTTTGRISYANWEEHPVGSDATSPRLARASVVNTFSGGIEAARTSCEYTIVYTSDKTGTFTGLQLLTGRLDGREGTFVVAENGGFDADGTVHGTFEVVPGSATGELAGLSGSGRYRCQAGEPSFPYDFGYQVD